MVAHRASSLPCLKQIRSGLLAKNFGGVPFTNSTAGLNPPHACRILSYLSEEPGNPKWKIIPVRTGKDKSWAMKTNGQLIEMLSRSEIFQNYRRAFTVATGMPVTLRPVTTWQLTFHGKSAGNAFCAVMATVSHTCAGCLRSQEKLAQDAMDEPATRTCAYPSSQWTPDNDP